MNGLDLFSGIGGISLALRDWVTPVAYCENDTYAQSVLLSRMADGSLRTAPIWDDVRTLSASILPPIDIITGGFPCQDISAAGKGAGLAGERSGLYFEIERLIQETKPTFVFLENVPAIRTRGLGRVVWGLSELGYDLRWTTLSAAEVGAPHLRKRWFLLAHTKGIRRSEGRPELRLRRRETSDASRSGEMGHAARERLGKAGRLRCIEPSQRISRPGETLGDAESTRPQGEELTQKAWLALSRHRHSSFREWPSWLPKPSLPRGDHGLSMRVDRTKGLGNAVVPLQAKTAFETLLGIRGVA